MDTETGKVREQILRVYVLLFSDDLGAEPGMKAGPDEVEVTADRLVGL